MIVAGSTWLATAAIVGTASGADVVLPDLDELDPILANVLRDRVEAIERSPNDADGWGELAIVLHAHNMQYEAEHAYVKAQNLAPMKFEWMYFHGVMLLKSDPARAVEQIQRAVDLDPTYAAARIRLGVALKAVSRDDEAHEAFAQALRMQPNNISGHIHMGQSELLRKNYDKAIEHLERALQARPTDAAVLGALAQGYARMGEREKAREMAHRAKAGEPGRVVDDARFAEVPRAAVSVAEFLTRFRVFFDAGNYAAARDEMERAFQLGHDAPALYGAMARVTLRMQDYEACIAAASRALELGLENDEMYVALGASFIALSRYAEAEEAISTALRLLPDDPNVHALHGNLAAAQGNDEEAIRRWEQSLSSVDDDSLRRLRAAALVRLGRTSEAEASLQAMVDADPTDVETWLALGNLYTADHRHAQALHAYQSAIPHANSAMPNRRAAALLFSADRPAEACNVLRQALRRWPRDANVRNELAWALATNPTDRIRNGRQAVRLIMPLVNQTNRGDAGVLDTYAAALAEAGRYDEAVQAMDEAIALLTDQQADAERLAGFKERRAGYRNGSPWRSE